MHSIPEPPPPEPVIVCMIGNVKVLGFAPGRVRVEGNTDDLAQIGREQLTRAIEATYDALEADQRARQWAKAACVALDHGEPVPTYFSGHSDSSTYDPAA